jgi:sialic acid synthase SpsE
MENLNDVIDTLQNSKCDSYDTGVISITPEQYREMMKQLNEAREALRKAEEMKLLIENTNNLFNRVLSK